MTVADGADVALGNTAAASASSDTGSFSVIALTKRGLAKVTALIAALPAALTGSGNFKVAMVESTAAQAVTNANLDAALSTLATQTTAAAIKTKTDNLDVALSTILTTSDFDTKIGALTETAPATDTASAGLNGRLQRIAQRLSSLIALVPTALTGSGNFKVSVAESTAAQAVTNANLDVGLSTLLTTSDFDSKAGALTEAAPATDTASSGLNGRLQRIAQRLTSLIALVPAALTGSGNFKVSVAESTATVTVDTELPAAATDADAFDIAATAIPKVGAILHAMSAGGTLAGRVLSHTSATDGRANTLNGLLVQSVPYCRNAANTNDAQRGINAATATTGTGVPSSGPALWDLVGTTNYVRQAGDGSGRAMVVGAAANAAAVAGNPVLVAGSDGTSAYRLLTDTSGRVTVIGGAAAGAAIAGNPVLTGLSDGTNARALLGDTGGRVIVVGAAASGAAQVGSPVLTAIQDNAGAVRIPFTGYGDTLSAAQVLAVVPTQFNGVTSERVRGTVDTTLLASAARTTTQTSADITTYNAHSLIVTLDVTATVSTVSLTLAINYKDPASGKYLPLLTGTTVAAAGTTTYAVNPYTPTATGPWTKVAQADLGRIIQIVLTVGNANSQTYSIGYTLIP